LKKTQDLSFKESYFKHGKGSLVKELEEKDNEQLTLSKTIAELNQKLVEKEIKMNIVALYLSKKKEKGR
jgi:hypothetical protein